MDHLFDEFSKSLAESVPRRESLRRLGAVFAGAVLSPLGVGTAWAGRRDPCQAFCKCRTTKQQSQCLAACRACNSNIGRIGGSCGNYVCCSTAACGGMCSDLLHDPNCGACGNNCHALGKACCSGHCADLATDVYNCGSCGTVCATPPPNETVACISGTCVYGCVAGAILCNGTCTPVNSDPDNCGACGNVCGGSTPYCNGGECTETYCNGADLNWDSNNCGYLWCRMPRADLVLIWRLRRLLRELLMMIHRRLSLPLSLQRRDRSWFICSMNPPSRWPNHVGRVPAYQENKQV